MSGPWDDYKAPDAAKVDGDAEGPWADFAPATTKQIKPLQLTPEVGAGPIADWLGNRLEAVDDGIYAAEHKLPVVGPMIESGMAAVKSAVNPDLTYDQAMQGYQDESAKRQERSPVATAIGSVGGAVAGGALLPGSGVATQMLASGADSEVRKHLLNQKIDAPMKMLDTGSDTGNELVNMGLEGVAGKGGEYAGDLFSALRASRMRGKAVDAVVDTFNPTVMKREALSVKSDKAQQAAEHLLDNGVFSNPFKGKRALAEDANALRKNAFNKSDEILNTESGVTKKQELLDYLSGKQAKAGANWNPELDQALSGEVSSLQKASGYRHETGPQQMVPTASVDSMGMSTTKFAPDSAEILPDTIRARKTALDSASRDSIGKVVDPGKAEAADSIREFQRNKLPEDASMRYDQANADYGKAKTATDLLSREAAREEGQTLLGKTDRNFGYSAGQKAAETLGVVGVPQIGVAMAGAKAVQVMRQYSAPLRAWGYNLGAKVAENNGWVEMLAKAGEKGGQSGVASAHYLMTQRDPAYRMAHKDDSGTEKEEP